MRGIHLNPILLMIKFWSLWKSIRTCVIFGWTESICKKWGGNPLLLLLKARAAVGQDPLPCPLILQSSYNKAAKTEISKQSQKLSQVTCMLKNLFPLAHRIKFKSDYNFPNFSLSTFVGESSDTYFLTISQVLHAFPCISLLACCFLYLNELLCALQSLKLPPPCSISQEILCGLTQYSVDSTEL